MYMLEIVYNCLKSQQLNLKKKQYGTKKRKKENLIKYYADINSASILGILK